VTSDPVELIKQSIPDLLNGAFAEVRGKADGGDADAKKKVEELAQAAPMAVRVVLEGKAKKELYVVFEKGELRTVESAPSVPVLFAVAVGHEEFEVALGDLSEELERGFAKLKQKLPRLWPLRARASIDKVAKENLHFHYVVKDTPDFDEVRVKIALGGNAPPEKPTFTVTVAHDVIEQLRAKKLKPQNLLSKIQLSGDSARAMQLAMGLLQR
jgi:hypothetical protein